MPKIIVSDADGEREFALAGEAIGIGRVAGQNEIVLKVAEASRKHCRVFKQGAAWFVEDLGSSNGTRVNGRKVTQFELQDGDEIQVGLARLRFLESDVVAGPAAHGGDDDVELELSLEEEAWLRFDNGPRAGERIDLEGRLTIGRRSTNTLVLEEKGVSGAHVEVLNEAGSWRMRDLGSTNGTLLNGERVLEADLSSGDVLKVGVVEFVFGLGDFEPGQAASTAIMQEIDVGGEVFAVSDRNLHRKRRASLAVTLCALVAIVASAAWWITSGVGKDSDSRTIERVAGNLVGPGASFELEEIGEADYLVSRSDAVDYAEVSSPVHSGVQALEVTVNGDVPSAYVEFAAPIENISAAERLEIGGWFRTARFQGSASMSVIWEDATEREISVSHVVAPAGGSTWTKATGLVRPPEGTVRGRLAVGVHDAAGAVHVDDVFLLRHHGDASGSLAAHGATVFIDASAVVSIDRDVRDLVSAVEFGIDGGAGPVSPRRFIAGHERDAEAGGSRVTATVLPFGDFAGGEVEMAAERSEDGIRIVGRLAAAGDAVVRLEIDVPRGLVTVADGVAVRHTEAFARDGVAEVILGSGHRAARLRLPAPTRVTLNQSRAGSEFIIPAPRSGDASTFTLDVQLDFAAAAAELAQLTERASKAEVVEQRYGEAMRIHQEIINRYSFRQDLADRSTEVLLRLRDAGEKAVEEARNRIDDVIFFRTFQTDYESIRVAAESQISRYEGSDIADRLRAELERLAVAWKERDDGARDRLASNHLERGLDLMKPGKSAPTIARAFFNSVRALTSEDSELARRADEQLQKIRALVGAN